MNRLGLDFTLRVLRLAGLGLALAHGWGKVTGPGGLSLDGLRGGRRG